MSSSPCRANTTPPSNPVQSSSPAAELSARFERDVVSMRGALYRHAYRLSQNHQDTEDLVQETMMKAYTTFHTFQGGGTNLNAWVFRILTNTFISAYRKKKRQPVQCSTVSARKPFPPPGNTMSDVQQDGNRASQARPYGRHVDARPSHRAVPVTAQRQKLASAGTMILFVLALAMLCALIGAATALLVHPLPNGTHLSKFSDAVGGQSPYLLRQRGRRQGDTQHCDAAN